MFGAYGCTQNLVTGITHGVKHINLILQHQRQLFGGAIVNTESCFVVSE